MPLGGRLRHFAQMWHLATRWQRNVVERGLRWKFTSLPPPLSQALLSSYKPKTYPPHVEDILLGLLRENVISQCFNPLFISRIFTVPKSDGSQRLILDLSKLNLFLKAPSFYLPSIKNLKEALPLGSWAAKLDLKDAYLHVPVNPHFHRYLAFQWRGGFFQFQALPFGLCLAPAAFQGMMSFPLRLLREKGIHCLVYLDDWIVWSESQSKCQQDILIVAKLLSSLGFRLNFLKSELHPTQDITWLGARWDTNRLLVSLPQEKAQDFALMATHLLQTKSSSRKDWEKFLGQATFAGFVSPYINLRKKLLGPVLTILADPRQSTLPAYTWSALEWWTNQSNLTIPFLFHQRPPQTLIWTDACETGWGGHNQLGHWTAGDWDQESAQLHMNLKELKAVALTLESPLVPPGSSIRLFSDNSTTVQALKRQGSSRSRSVTLLVQSIMEVMTRKSLQIFPHKLPGKLNVLADALSRNCTLQGEWQIQNLDRDRILSEFPALQVDLMATPYNAILPRFVSPFLHPQAIAVDAWTVDWNNWQEVYLFPPPSLVPRVLKNLESFRGKMILVLRQHNLFFHNFPEHVLRPLFPLALPPHQLVRGQWVQDSRHKLSPWTVFLFCGQFLCQNTE